MSGFQINWRNPEAVTWSPYSAFAGQLEVTIGEPSIVQESGHNLQSGGSGVASEPLGEATLDKRIGKLQFLERKSITEAAKAPGVTASDKKAALVGKKKRDRKQP
ncbi:MAG: hypothetical protein MMC33_009807 [Icmadophila ericetorum]|nr:hypothetical protein [Icmadophila ericetorum]